MGYHHHHHHPLASPGSKGIPEYFKFRENGVLLLPCWPVDGGGGGIPQQRDVKSAFWAAVGYKGQFLETS